MMCSIEVEILLSNNMSDLLCKVAVQTVRSSKITPVTHFVVQALADGRQCGFRKVNVRVPLHNVRGLQRAFKRVKFLKVKILKSQQSW